jgi:ribosome-binding factor A
MAAEKSFKKAKLAERILAVCNEYLRTEANDPRLVFASVTKVELSPDNSHATLYWDSFDSGQRGDAKRALEAVQGRLRSHLARVLDIRHVPALSFAYDAQFESEQHITSILEAEKKNGKFES